MCNFIYSIKNLLRIALCIRFVYNIMKPYSYKEVKHTKFLFIIQLVKFTNTKY